jgi:hypothetical protein
MKGSFWTLHSHQRSRICGGPKARIEQLPPRVKECGRGGNVGHRD